MITNINFELSIKIKQLLTISTVQIECHQNKSSCQHQNLKIKMTTAMQMMTMMIVKTMMQVLSSQMY